MMLMQIARCDFMALELVRFVRLWPNVSYFKCNNRRTIKCDIPCNQFRPRPTDIFSTSDDIS